MFPLFVRQRSELLKYGKLAFLSEVVFLVVQWISTIFISLRVERMDTVMTRQALFQARIFRKSKIRATLYFAIKVYLEHGSTVINSIKKAIYYGICMILWDVVFCLHNVAYWFLNEVLNCLDNFKQALFLVKLGDSSWTGLLPQMMLPCQKTRMVIINIFKEDLFHCVYF